MFIATQGPMSNTISSFWKMCLIKKVPLILMLCNLKEECRTKCDQYWPAKVGELTTFGDIHITMNSEEIILDTAILRRSLNVKFIDEENTKYENNIVQLQIICWPDHSIPEEEKGFKAVEILCSLVESSRELSANSPIVVHCSAGIGRTGTFMALFNIYYAVSRLKQQKETIQFNIFNTVRKLREQRYSLVTDVSQYKFIYSFVIEWIKRNVSF